MNSLLDEVKCSNPRHVESRSVSISMMTLSNDRVLLQQMLDLLHE